MIQFRLDDVPRGDCGLQCFREYAFEVDSGKSCRSKLRQNSANVFFNDAPCLSFCKYLARVPGGLPAKERPHRLDQHYPQVFGSVSVDRAEALHPARAVLARTTARITADRFAMRKAPPIAHFPCEQRYRQRA